MKANQEKWKWIEGFENLYMVSDQGRVKSVERDIEYSDGRIYHYPETIIKPNPNPNRKGYLQVFLYKDKKRYVHKIHRLVAKAFIPNPNNYSDINHKNKDVKDNSVSNIEWCDKKYNNNYLDHNELVSKYRSKPVVATNLVTGETVYFKRQVDALKTHKHSTSIIRCLRGAIENVGCWKYSYA